MSSETEITLNIKLQELEEGKTYFMPIHSNRIISEEEYERLKRNIKNIGERHNINFVAPVFENGTTCGIAQIGMDRLSEVMTPDQLRKIAEEIENGV